MKNAPFFSVVLPTFNRKDKLLECLGSLEAQTYPRADFEVIVVDDGSADGTQASVEAFSARSQLQVSCHRQQHAGPSAARNAGAGKAKGAVIAFTEDDVVPDTRWLELAARYFADPATAAMEGRTRSGSSGSSGNLRSFETPGTRGFLPCNLFVRREVFLAVGGFDPGYCDLSLNLYFREDADFGFRLLEHRYGTLSGADVVVSHPEQFHTPRDVFRHARRYLFDPLLYRNHPALYRELIEVKRLGVLTIHRPFHYLCWFYLVCIIAILTEIFSGHHNYLPVCLIVMLVVHMGIRFRYERTAVPALWNIPATLAFIVLPVYYLAWFIRGCARFGSWGALL